MRKLLAKDVYLGFDAGYLAHKTRSGLRGWGGERAIIVGSACGPMLLCAGPENLQECIDEYDERYGVCVELDDPDLLDYEPEPHHLAEANGDRRVACLLAAQDAGDVRVNDGGTTVWVDHYEWILTFATVREAGRYWRQGGAS